VANTLAYYDTAAITASKGFIVQGPGGKDGHRFCCNLILVKNHKISNNSTTTEGRAKNKHRSGNLRI
jgi:hypothetical protein